MDRYVVNVLYICHLASTVRMCMCLQFILLNHLIVPSSHTLACNSLSTKVYHHNKISLKKFNIDKATHFKFPSFISIMALYNFLF